ncbi:tRNA lysidine(34) synthetase TilS [Pontibacter sp. JAM-7]|uniref:tRNA lysidine(34) synthetase TilS n=1 Tax=Pontibacter sp. JAM-7 TaxID=3366581 RepID=UPI003AF46572
MDTKPSSDLVALCQQHFSAALQNATNSSSHPITRWVIGHSGGLDSQVLLHLASALLPTRQLYCLHINHQLQPESFHWAEFSAAEAQKLGIEHGCMDVRPTSASEDAAREARYNAFSDFLQPGECLLLAQHADDQAETVLFRLVRGSGPNGLAGMPASRSLGVAMLYRPLLELSRAALEAYAHAHQLNWVEDPSNSDTRYARNLLRQEVLPALQRHWPGVSEQIRRAAKLTAQHTGLLNTYLDEDLAVLTAGNVLDLVALASKPQTLQRQLIRRWLEQSTGLLLNEIQLQEIQDRVVNAADDAQPVFHKAQFSLRRYRQKLYLCQDSEVALVMHLSLSQPGQFTLGDGTLHIESGVAGLKTLQGLELHRRQGGERCRPQGRGCSMTVKSLLQEAAIPPWLRPQWPLLYAGEELVAVAGVCIAEGWYAPDAGFSVKWRSFALSAGV